MILQYDTLDGLALRSMGGVFPITADAPSGRATFFHLPRRGIFGPADDPDSGERVAQGQPVAQSLVSAMLRGLEATNRLRNARSGWFQPHRRKNCLQ